MGSFAISTTSTNDITGRIEWSESNVSIANNTSDLNVKLIYRMNASQYATLGSGYFKITVNGVAYEDNHYVTFASGTHEYTVIDHTFTITHDANGAKSVSIVVNNGYVAGSSGLSASSGSGTATLTTIARATVPSAPSSCYFGSSITISMPRASSSFVHQLVISIGQAHIYETAANLGTSYTFNIPSSWADVCYNSTSSTLTIGCRTYNGSSQVGGTQVISSTIYVPDSWKPTVSISKSVSNGGDSGQVIAGVSTVNLTASGSAPAGTGIASYSWSGGAVSGTGASKSHSPSATGNYTYTVTVTDQRGRTGSATVTASAVSGVSPFSCAGSVNFGSALAVSISRIKSSFTHNVAYTINSSYTNTLTGQGTSASYTIPTSWAASVPAASAINMTVTVTTYNGSTSLGSTSKTVSVVVPSSWVPAFTLSTEAVSAFNSQYLKGVSKVKLTASSVSPSTGSQIASYSFTGNNLNKTQSSTATSYNVTSDLLTVVGTNTYTVKVTDKRGRVTTKTASITVVNYAPPTIKLSVGRYDSGGTADNFGGYGRMFATGSWVAVSGNSWTLTLKQKKKTASSYTTVNTWSSQTTSAVSKTSDLFAADVDNAYDCQATITDAVGKSSTVTVALSTGQAMMDLFKDKVISFFSTANEAIRSVFGNPSSLWFSNAKVNALNGTVMIGKNESTDMLTDGTFNLNWASTSALLGTPQYSINANDDLNSKIQIGTHVCGRTEAVPTLSHCPATDAFRMFVTTIANNAWLDNQWFYRNQIIIDLAGNMYERHGASRNYAANMTWSAWHAIGRWSGDGVITPAVTDGTPTAGGYKVFSGTSALLANTTGANFFNAGSNITSGNMTVVQNTKFLVIPSSATGDGALIGVGLNGSAPRIVWAYRNNGKWGASGMITSGGDHILGWTTLAANASVDFSRNGYDINGPLLVHIYVTNYGYASCPVGSAFYGTKFFVSVGSSNYSFTVLKKSDGSGYTLRNDYSASLSFVVDKMI